MKISLLKLVRGERVDSVTGHCLTEMQGPGSCDHCGKDLPRGARVLGKTVCVSRGVGLSSRFSPTCLSCANMN